VEGRADCAAADGDRGTRGRRCHRGAGRLQQRGLLRAVDRWPPDLLRRARPVAEVLADPATPAALRERLELSQRLRDFAVDELALPDNRSYRRYADLQRNAVVWNVVAAPELSLTLKTWCFPLLGCVGYRGYFDRAAAEALAAQLRAEGWEVDVYGCPPTPRSLDPTGWAATRCSTPSCTGPRASWRASSSRAGAPGGVRRRRHPLQRVLRHRGGAAGWPALADAARRRRRARPVRAAGPPAQRLSRPHGARARSTAGAVRVAAGRRPPSASARPN